MAYPEKYYRMQAEVMQQVRYAHSTGLCPVCRTRPCGTWPDGKRRITCGERRCFYQWLPIHAPEEEETNAQ